MHHQYTVQSVLSKTQTTSINGYYTVSVNLYDTNVTSGVYQNTGMAWCNGYNIQPTINSESPAVHYDR